MCARAFVKCAICGEGFNNGGERDGKKHCEDCPWVGPGRTERYRSVLERGVVATCDVFGWKVERARHGNGAVRCRLYLETEQYFGRDAPASPVRVIVFEDALTDCGKECKVYGDVYGDDEGTTPVSSELSGNRGISSA